MALSFPTHHSFKSLLPGFRVRAASGTLQVHLPPAESNGRAPGDPGFSSAPSDAHPSRFPPRNSIWAENKAVGKYFPKEGLGSGVHEAQDRPFIKNLAREWS